MKKDDNSQEEIGTVMEIPLGNFSMSDKCALYRDYVLNFQQDFKKEIHVLNLEGQSHYQIKSEERIGGDFKWVFHWKENSFVLCGEKAKKLGTNKFQNKITIVSVFEEDCEEMQNKVPLSMKANDYDIEEEFDFSTSTMVQMDQDSIYFWNLDELQGRINLESLSFEKILDSKQNKIHVWSKIKLFCKNTLFYCEDIKYHRIPGLNYQMEQVKTPQTLKFFNLSDKIFREINFPYKFSFVESSCSVNVVGKYAYIISEKPEIWVLDPKTMTFGMKGTLGVPLPRGKLQSISSKNRILFWKPTSSKLYLLTLGKDSATEILGENPLLKSRQSNMQKLLTEKKFADVIFIVEKQEIPAHRNILIQSKYFENMFESGMKETTAQRIPISDISIRAFQALLESMYCGTVKLDETLASEVIIQADKYALPELKLLCEFELLKYLHLKSLIRIAQLIEKIEAPYLEKKIVELLSKNSSKIGTSIDTSKLPHKIIFQALSILNPKLKSV